MDFMNRAYTIPAIPTRPVERMPDQLHMRLLRPVDQSRSCGRTETTDGNAARARAAGSVRAPRAGLCRLPIAPAAPADAGRDVGLAPPHAALQAPDAGRHRAGPRLRGLRPRAARALQTGGRVGGDARPGADPPRRPRAGSRRARCWCPSRGRRSGTSRRSIQRRARALRDHLSGPQLLEAIGVASLANGLCRLGAMVAGPGMTRAVLVGAALGAAGRPRRRALSAVAPGQGLQAQLDAAAVELQHLQEACSRLAPAGVVQRLVADRAERPTAPSARW